MEATFSFQPKTKTLRLFTLLEATDFFVLIGTDKLTRVAHMIHLRKFNDNKAAVQLRDIMDESPQTMTHE